MIGVIDSMLQGIGGCLMGTFVRIAKTNEIPTGQVKRFDIGSYHIALCNVGGDFFAVDDTCTHEDASLAEGELDGEELECPRHFARFNIKTGEVTAPPAYADLSTYRVRVSGDDVEVELP